MKTMMLLFFFLLLCMCTSVNAGQIYIVVHPFYMDFYSAPVSIRTYHEPIRCYRSYPNIFHEYPMNYREYRREQKKRWSEIQEMNNRLIQKQIFNDLVRKEMINQRKRIRYEGIRDSRN